MEKSGAFLEKLDLKQLPSWPRGNFHLVSVFLERGTGISVPAGIYISLWVLNPDL